MSKANRATAAAAQTPDVVTLLQTRVALVAVHAVGVATAALIAVVAAHARARAPPPDQAFAQPSAARQHVRALHLLDLSPMLRRRRRPRPAHAHPCHNRHAASISAWAMQPHNPLRLRSTRSPIPLPPSSQRRPLLRSSCPITSRSDPTACRCRLRRHFTVDPGRRHLLHRGRAAWWCRLLLHEVSQVPRCHRHSRCHPLGLRKAGEGQAGCSSLHHQA